MKQYTVKEAFAEDFTLGMDTMFSESELIARADAHHLRHDYYLGFFDETELRKVWVSSEADDNSEVCSYFYTRAEAVEAAKMTLAHLTKRERERRTVSVQSFTLPCKVGMSAVEAVQLAWEYCYSPMDSESYEIINDWRD